MSDASLALEPETLDLTVFKTPLYSLLHPPQGFLAGGIASQMMERLLSTPEALNTVEGGARIGITTPRELGISRPISPAEAAARLPKGYRRCRPIVGPELWILGPGNPIGTALMHPIQVDGGDECCFKIVEGGGTRELIGVRQDRGRIEPYEKIFFELP